MKCALEEFTRTYGTKVTYVAGQSPENAAKVFAQRSSPTIDVVFGAEGEHINGVRQGLYEKLDTTSVENLRGVPTNLQRTDGFGVLFTSVVVGLEYNTKVFSEKGWSAPTSWLDLWDPRYQGHAAITSISTPNGLGLFARVADLMGDKLTNTDKTFARFAQLRPNLYTIYQTLPALDQGLQQGAVWIAANTGNRVFPLKQQGISVEFVQPREGMVVIPLTLDLVRGAPHPRAGRALIDHFLSEKVQSCLPSIGYGVVNGRAVVPRDLALYVGSPDIAATYFSPSWDALQQNLSVLVERWNKEIERK